MGILFMEIEFAAEPSILDALVSLVKPGAVAEQQRENFNHKGSRSTPRGQMSGSEFSGWIVEWDCHPGLCRRNGKTSHPPGRCRNGLRAPPECRAALRRRWRGIQSS